MSDHIKEVNEDNFEQAVLHSNRPVVVDFWAEWCPPCRTLSPIVDAIARHYAGAIDVFKLNVDENPSVTQRYAIQGIPTLILFKEGRERERIVGVVSEEAISRMIDNQMEPSLVHGDKTSPGPRKAG